jgi:catechol 2,3-dioxygenase-like lactoylglutathione lyase family enzyme
MSNTFHVALYVQDIPSAVAQYRKVLGPEPATGRAVPLASARANATTGPASGRGA